MSEKRRDSKNRILHNRESQRKEGRYMFKYLDADGNAKYFTAGNWIKMIRLPRANKENCHYGKRKSS